MQKEVTFDRVPYQKRALHKIKFSINPEYVYVYKKLFGHHVEFKIPLEDIRSFSLTKKAGFYTLDILTKTERSYFLQGSRILHPRTNNYDYRISGISPYQIRDVERILSKKGRINEKIQTFDRPVHESLKKPFEVHVALRNIALVCIVPTFVLLIMAILFEIKFLFIIPPVVGFVFLLIKGISALIYQKSYSRYLLLEGRFAVVEGIFCLIIAAVLAAVTVYLSFFLLQ